MDIQQQLAKIAEQLKQIEYQLAELTGRKWQAGSRLERRGNAEPKG